MQVKIQNQFLNFLLNKKLNFNLYCFLMVQTLRKSYCQTGQSIATREKNYLYHIPFDNVKRDINNNNTKKICSLSTYLNIIAVHVTLYFHFLKLTLWKVFTLSEYLYVFVWHGCSKVWNMKKIGNLTGNLVICKFEADNSTRRTILFGNSCHVCRNNTVPLITIKINSNSEREVASWNIKRMKMN